MHEFSIISNIFDIIETTASKEGLKKIHKVDIVVGKMIQVIPETMCFAFKAVAKGTIAEHAELNMEIIPIKMKCNKCNKTFMVHENVYICPECLNTNITLLEGKELLVKSIKGDK